MVLPITPPPIGDAPQINGSKERPGSARTHAASCDTRPSHAVPPPPTSGRTGFVPPRPLTYNRGIESGDVIRSRVDRPRV